MPIRWIIKLSKEKKESKMEVLQWDILQQSFCDTHFLIHLAELFQCDSFKMPNKKCLTKGFVTMFAIKASNKGAEPQNDIR